MASIFSNLKSFGDYQKAEQEFRLRKQKAIAEANGSSGNAPAALQLANEYQRRVAAGDQQGADLIAQFAKTVDRGVVTAPGGGYMSAPGYDDLLANRKALSKGAETQAQKNVDIVMNPQIAGAEADAKNESELDYAPKITAAKDKAKADAEKAVDLGERIASLPQLENTVAELNKLGKKATYTATGRAADWLVRETSPLRGVFFDKPAVATEGAIARNEYTSLIDNQVLPLLRQTFGAQFTQKEGESLKATLGDPNLSPPEKEAVLRSFIDQKKQTINSKERELGLPETIWGANGSQSAIAPTQAPKLRPSKIPMNAAQALKDNPELASQFDAKYGAGASKLVLGK